MNEAESEKKKIVLNKETVLQKLQEKLGDKLGGGEKKAGLILQAAYRIIGEALKTAESGAVVVQGLGIFKIRPPAKEGEKAGPKRIGFRPVGGGGGKKKKGKKGKNKQKKQQSPE